MPITTRLEAPFSCHNIGKPAFRRRKKTADIFTMSTVFSLIKAALRRIFYQGNSVPGFWASLFFVTFALSLSLAFSFALAAGFGMPAEVAALERMKGLRAGFDAQALR